MAVPQKLTPAAPTLPATEQEERLRLTLEALADVDAGQVFDHRAIQAWVESLATDSPLPVPH